MPRLFSTPVARVRHGKSVECPFQKIIYPFNFLTNRGILYPESGREVGVAGCARFLPTDSRIVAMKTPWQKVKSKKDSHVLSNSILCSSEKARME